MFFVFRQHGLFLGMLTFNNEGHTTQEVMSKNQTNI